MSTTQRGFTLIELLIVVAIIAIVAAIALPNLQSAMQKANQSRTMADMRTVGQAVETYALDSKSYPVGLEGPARAVICGLLEPNYVPRCPDKDAWGTPFHFTSDNEGASYSLTSYGRGGQPGGGVPGPTSNFSDDIIYSRGAFTQYPEGAQK